MNYIADDEDTLEAEEVGFSSGWLEDELNELLEEHNLQVSIRDLSKTREGKLGVFMDLLPLQDEDAIMSWTVHLGASGWAVEALLVNAEELKELEAEDEDSEETDEEKEAREAHEAAEE